ncbi:MAG: hypothetical protein ACTHL6_08200 [Arthrobacter sp.]
MTTRAVASLLRRAWLLAATLAVIAGLLGMHVLTSGHSSHASVSGGAIAGHTAVAHSAGDVHAVHAGHHPTAPDPALDAPVLGSAGCGGSCPGAQEPGAPCVPPAPSGAVTISPPQASLADLPVPAATGTAGADYGYLPPSPTPCDLSISRT